jgi:hypothetical protein
MQLGPYKKRQRFLSEQIDIISKNEDPTPPHSPPTPKIQPLKLLIEEEEMEELIIPESEDFQLEDNHNFSIQFSTTAEDPAGVASRQKLLESHCDVFSRRGKRPVLEKTRSKSMDKLCSVGLIYDFLHFKYRKA